LVALFTQLPQLSQQFALIFGYFSLFFTPHKQQRQQYEPEKALSASAVLIPPAVITIITSLAHDFFEKLEISLDFQL
jgi:hypothetical protein